jgi:Mg2+/Co2+ transporter CorC
MDTNSRPNRESINLADKDEYGLLYKRIIETCKHSNSDFTINSKQLTDNINFLFSSSYSQKDVDYVLGEIYEKQFYHTPDKPEHYNNYDL